MPFYEIKDWDRIFENSESRKYKKLNWVPIPNKWDGFGFCKLRKHKNFVTVFCGWSLIVQIASKMPHRGILVTAEGWELSPVDMADLTGCPEDVFCKSLEILCTPEIGWIVRRESENLPVSPNPPGDSPSVSESSSVEREREREREQKEREGSAPAKGGFVEYPKKWQEVQQAAELIGYAMTQADAENFMAKWEAKGWKDGKTAITDWRRLLTTWKNNASKFNKDESGYVEPKPLPEAWRNKKS